MGVPQLGAVDAGERWSGLLRAFGTGQSCSAPVVSGLRIGGELADVLRAVERHRTAKHVPGQAPVTRHLNGGADCVLPRLTGGKMPALAERHCDCVSAVHWVAHRGEGLAELCVVRGAGVVGRVSARGGCQGESRC